MSASERRAWPSAVGAVLLSIVACSSDDEPAPPPQLTDEPAPAPVPRPPPDPVDASAPPCLDQLRARGVSFQTTKARGVVDAVQLTGPVDGVLFARGDTNEPSRDPMACTFALRVLDFAAILKARGVERVGTLGAYCYRCCCSWSRTNDCRGPDDPEPDCGTAGYSNHSWGRALDVRYVYLRGGRRLDINAPATWVKTPATGTCTTGLAAQKGDSKLLYEIACATWERKIFGTILTPNHNAAHRNHWHMDTGESGTPAESSIKSLPMRAPAAVAEIDVATDPEACGDE